MSRLSFNLVTVVIIAFVIIILALLSEVFTQGKAENSVISWNLTKLVYEGVVLGELGNYTGSIEYFDKVLAVNPHDF